MATPFTSTSPAESEVHLPGRIIFFDGECLLCNGFVDLMLQLDPEGVFTMAPLQGQTAQRLLPPLSANAEDWSMVYWEDGNIYNQSDAALTVMARMGGFWTVLSWGRVIPRFIRDGIYRIIARNRYRWFGRRETCRMPSPQERERFLP